MSKRNLSFAIILLFSFLRPNSYCHGGDPDEGLDIDIHNAFSGSFAVEYSLWGKLFVLGQINGPTSPYGPDIRSLSDDALQILFGIKYRFLKKCGLADQLHRGYRWSNGLRFHHPNGDRILPLALTFQG